MEPIFRKKKPYKQQANQAIGYAKYEGGRDKNKVRKYDHQIHEKTQQKVNLTREQLEFKAALIQRLRNVHRFYKIRIQEQNSRRIQNDRIFLDTLHENQQNHKQVLIHFEDKIQEIKLNQSNLHKRQQNVLKMKSSFQQSIYQIDEMIGQNMQLQDSIENTRQRISQKQGYIGCLQKEERIFRDQVQANERQNLKVKKWKKQLELMLSNGQQYMKNMKKMLEKEEEF